MDIDTFSHPGGSLGFPRFEHGSQAETAANRWKGKLSSEEQRNMLALADPDFVEAFIQAIPDEEEQIRYILNTSQFLDGKEADFTHVFLYRRSLPSEEPKPERHWTSDYITARKGLRQEIPGMHRLYSVILCSSLQDVLSDSGASQNLNGAVSDGEIKVDTPIYNQQRCLFVFRPKDQEEELKRYQQNPSSLSIEAINTQIKELKTK